MWSKVMRNITKHYIDGAFVDPHGREVLQTFNTVNSRVSGPVLLADDVDARRAIAAVKHALPAFSRTTKEERVKLLRRMHEATAARLDDLKSAMVEEYGGTLQFSKLIVEEAVEAFRQAEIALNQIELVRKWGTTTAFYQPVGVAGLITPWNANVLFLCVKTASAIAAGCTVVAKPSELSAWQTQVLLECLHEAGLPQGVLNVVSGRGEVVGAEFVRNPDVDKISFTGSAAVGQSVMRDGAATMKRITLELGGKSPNIILDDADLQTAIPNALVVAFLNSGQACAAGTRLLVPNHQLDSVKSAILDAMREFPVGLPSDPKTAVGPMVTEKQYERVQALIRKGIEQGAQVLVGGEGRPKGLEEGYFVKPTVFVNVKNDMTIAQEEIFGPVLCVIGYENEEDAIRIANDTRYGLHGFVSGADPDRARSVASQILAGRVAINGMRDDQQAPFGGFKHSGFGREFGTFGIEAFLEARAILE
jgi:aldehyde dehydrogenase (NAD+)